MYCAFLIAPVLLLGAQVIMAAPSTMPATPMPGILKCIHTVIQGTLKKHDCTEAQTKVDELLGQMVDGFQQDVQALTNVLGKPLEKCVNFRACADAFRDVPKQLLAIASKVIKRIVQLAVDFSGLVHSSMKCVGVVTELPSMVRGVFKCIV